MLKMMSPLSLLLCLPPVLLLASAQPLDARRIGTLQGNLSYVSNNISSVILEDPPAKNLGNLGHGANDIGSMILEDPAAKNVGNLGHVPNNIGSMILANPLAKTVGCFQSPKNIYSGIQVSSGKEKNSTTGCQSPAALTHWGSLVRDSIWDGGQNLLGPAIKTPAEAMVWPTDASVAYNIPSANGPKQPELPSRSQQVYIPAPMTPVESKPLVTLIAAPRSQTSSPESAFGIVIAGSTMTPVTPAITVSSISLSLAVNEQLAAIGDATQKLIPPTPPPVLSPLIFGGSVYNRNSASQYMIGGQTLNQGNQITISGTPISLAADGATTIIGRSTQILAPLTSTPQPAILTLAGSTYTADLSSLFYIKGQILKLGGSVQVQGNTVSLNHRGTVVVIDSSNTQILASVANPPQPAIFTLAGSIYTADSSPVLHINGQTLKPGGVIQVQGNAVSLDQGGTAIVIGGSSTQTLVSVIKAPQFAVLTFAGLTYTADSSTRFNINGQTLEPGGAINVQGYTVSFDQGGTVVVIGSSSTQTLSHASIIGAARPAFIFNGTSVGQDIASDFVVDGQTLSKGGVVTISGTPISFAAEGTAVVVGTSTQILGGERGFETGLRGGASGVAEFEGGADVRHKVKRWYLGLGAGILLLWNILDIY